MGAPGPLPVSVTAQPSVPIGHASRPYIIWSLFAWFDPFLTLFYYVYSQPYNFEWLFPQHIVMLSIGIAWRHCPSFRAKLPAWPQRLPRTLGFFSAYLHLLSSPLLVTTAAACRLACFFHSCVVSIQAPLNRDGRGAVPCGGTRGPR